ncbi:hypothetical protein Tcan_01386, partial [Toxocara canis]
LRDHFEKLARSCSISLYSLRTLRTLRPYLPINTAVLLVECFVISRIRIFSEITGTAAKKELNLIQKIINNAIRVIYKQRKFDHIKSFCERFKWGEIGKLLDSTFQAAARKAAEGRSSNYLQNLIQKSTHNKTRKEYYVNEKPNTNIGRRRFRHRATTFLNRT